MRFTTVTMGFTKKKKKIMAVLCGMAMAVAPYGFSTGWAAPAPAAVATAAGEQPAAETAAVQDKKVSAEAVKADKLDKDTAGVKAEQANTAAEKAGEAAAVKPEDARTSLDTAFDHLAEVKNGTYDLDLATSAPMGSAVMSSNITFVSEPYTRAKGSLDITFTLPGAPAFEREIAYYIRETEKATAFYCKLGHGAWEKSVTPRKPADKKVNDFWAEAFTNGFIDMAKNVQFGVQDGNCQTYLVTVDGKAFGKLLLEQLKPMAKDEDMQKTTEEICRSLPDFTYTVTIDTEKNLLTDMHANLTEPIRKVASIIVKRRDLTRAEREEMLKDIRESTVDLHLQGKDFNALEDVQVPAEILASAKATELPLEK